MPIISRLAASSASAYGFGKSLGLPPLIADYLVVGGGASGAGVNNRSCGGGGAGGFREFTSQTLLRNNAYTVTVGAGGAGLSLSSANSAYDVCPYIIRADNSILLGTPQIGFA